MRFIGIFFKKWYATPYFMKTVNILGVEIADIRLDQALGLASRYLEDEHQHYIVTPNPEIILAARADDNLRKILNHADFALPDGMGLHIAARILGEKLSYRIPGVDFSEALAALSEEDHIPVFLLGGRSEKIAEKAAWRLRYLYKNIKIVGHASGGDVLFKNGSWQTADTNIINSINASNAEILFVGFGCPKQEKWIFTNLDKMPKVKIALAIGGTLDFWAGKSRRAPLFMRTVGLEWLWRLIIEPSRYKRIWNATAGFMKCVLVWRLRMAAQYRHNVVGCIINEKNKILLVRRANEKNEHWQLPQGGVEANETEAHAIMREMREETGLTDLRILGMHPRKHTYTWPRWHSLQGGYKGQKQTIFFLAPNKSDTEVQIDAKEISHYEWVAIDDILEKVHDQRKPLVAMALAGYRQLTQHHDAR